MKNNDLINEGIPLDIAGKTRRNVILRSWKNVIVLGLVFILVSSAENAMLFVQSTVHSSAGLGVISTSVICITCVFSSLLLPKLVMDKVGLRWTIVLSIFGYACYIAANGYAQWTTLIPGAVVLGIAQGPMWTAQPCYVTRVGAMRAQLTGEDKDALVAKALDVFFVMYQVANIPGSLVSSLVLSRESNRTVVMVADNEELQCGRQYCPWHAADKSDNGTSNQLNLPSETTVWIFVGVCTGMCLVAIPLALFGLDPEQKDVEEDTTLPKRDTTKRSLFAAIVLHKQLKMWLLVPMSITNGIIISFITAEWTEAYVSCTLGVHMVGWCTLPYGIGVSVFSYISGWVAEKTNRITVFILSSTMLCGLCVTLVMWTPRPDQLWAFLLIPGLWGIAESPWYPQVTAIFGEAFPENSDAAYSNYNVWFGIGSAIAYAYSSFLCTPIKVYIIIVAIVVAMMGYILSLVVGRKRAGYHNIAESESNIQQSS